MTVTYPERILIVLNADGSFKAAHQEDMTVLDDGRGVQGLAKAIELDAIKKILPESGPILVQAQQAILGKEQLDQEHKDLLQKFDYASNRLTEQTEINKGLSEQVVEMPDVMKQLIDANAQIRELNMLVDSLTSTNAALGVQNSTLTAANVVMAGQVSALNNQSAILQSQVQAQAGDVNRVFCFGWQGRSVLKSMGSYPEAVVYVQQQEQSGSPHIYEAFFSAQVWYKDAAWMQGLATYLGLDDNALTMLFLKAKDISA